MTDYAATTSSSTSDSAAFIASDYVVADDGVAAPVGPKGPRSRGDMLKVGGVALGAAIAGSLAGAGTAAAAGNNVQLLSPALRAYDSRQPGQLGKLTGAGSNFGSNLRGLIFPTVGFPAGV